MGICAQGASKRDKDLDNNKENKQKSLNVIDFKKY